MVAVFTLLYKSSSSFILYFDFGFLFFLNFNFYVKVLSTKEEEIIFELEKKESKKLDFFKITRLNESEPSVQLQQAEPEQWNRGPNCTKEKWVQQ